MNRVPRIGSKVRFGGNSVVGACIGVVLAHYPKDALDADGEVMPGTLAPQREWHVSVQVDNLPERWAYPGTSVFAPCVGNLSKTSSS